MSHPPRLRRAAAMAVLLAALAGAPLAVAAATDSAPAAAPDPAHQVTRDDLDELASRLGPAGRLALEAIERGALAEAARAEQAGRITAGRRAAVERCLATGHCAGADTERGLDAVVDRLVTDSVEEAIEPALEAVPGD